MTLQLIVLMLSSSLNLVELELVVEHHQAVVAVHQFSSHLTVLAIHKFVDV